MEWDICALREGFNEYDNTVDDILNSDSSIYEQNLNRFINLLKNNPNFNYILDMELPKVDFITWYNNACKTVKSMVGSGQLDWPIDKKELLSLQKAFFEYIANGNESLPNFCCKFMYAGSSNQDCIDKVNDQLFRPFSRDLKQLLNRISLEAISEVSPNIETSIVKKPWYERPLGLISIGVIITIVGQYFIKKIF